MRDFGFSGKEYTSSADIQQLRESWTAQGFLHADFTAEAYDLLTAPRPGEVPVPRLKPEKRLVVEVDRSFGAPLGSMRERWRKFRPTRQEQRAHQQQLHQRSSERWTKRARYEQDIAEGRETGVIPLPGEPFHDWERRFLATWLDTLAKADAIAVELERCASEGGLASATLQRSTPAQGHGRLSDAHRSSGHGELVAAVGAGLRQRLQTGRLTVAELDEWYMTLGRDPRGHRLAAPLLADALRVALGERLLAFISAHPGATSEEIATGVALPDRLASAALGALVRSRALIFHQGRYQLQ
jgi:hypothetical protein